ncbi:MAG TPA: response regulator [Ignavibacteriales bacterium]|nr:response regulator [Ignavibacteriales bacterium]
MPHIFKILYLEDNSLDAELVEAALKESGIYADLKIVQTQDDFTRELEDCPYILIFSDYSLPSFSGKRALEIAKQICPDVPFIFISGTMGEDAAIDSLLNGATDYVLKSKLPRLVPAVNRALKELKDLNEKKKAQKELVESEERFRMLAENAMAFIAIYTRGKIIYANPAFINSSGYRAEELYSLNIWDIVTDDFKDEIKWRVEMRVKGEPIPPRFEFKLKTKDSQEIWLDASSSAITYQGERSGLVYMLDITKKKETELAMKEAKDRAEEMNRLKSFFLSNMSHELRTPLNGIMGFAELLLHEAGEEDKPKAAAILKSASRLNETLNMILDLSRLEANARELKLQSFDIGKCAEKAAGNFAALAKNKKINLRFIPPPESVFVKIDGKLFHSVMSNLINNAIKYTQEGSVTISVNKENMDGKTKAVIKIADTGIGIPPEKLPMIYEEFRQASEGFSRGFEGLGIGLTITKKFVEMMNGVIEVQSQLNKGTEFMIKFDTADNLNETKKNGSLTNSHEKANGKNLNILIVEDEEINRSLARLFLRKFAKTDEAINASEALAKCRENIYDAVLMDINLGKGMNGLEAAREIRKFQGYSDIPIIAITAYALDEEENKYLTGGCTHYLPKPYNQGQLIALLSELVV